MQMPNADFAEQMKNESHKQFSINILKFDMAKTQYRYYFVWLRLNSVGTPCCEKELQWKLCFYSDYAEGNIPKKGGEYHFTLLLHYWKRKTILKIIKTVPNCFLASDCHGTEKRIPNLKSGLNEIRRRTEDEIVNQLIQTANELISR